MGSRGRYLDSPGHCLSSCGVSYRRRDYFSKKIRPEVRVSKRVVACQRTHGTPKARVIACRGVSWPRSFFSSLPFVTSFLSHKLLCPDRSVLPSVSTLPFYLLRLCLRINSLSCSFSSLFLSIRCVCAYVFLSFQFSSSICYFFSFA